jgi:hypothetical protein
MMARMRFSKAISSSMICRYGLFSRSFKSLVYIRAILCSAADPRTHALLRAESQSFLRDRHNRLAISLAVGFATCPLAEAKGSNPAGGRPTG